MGTPGRGPGLRIRVGAETNVGRVRTNNEDAFLATGRLFAVADGMGGLEAGEVASGLAMDTLRTRIQEEATTPLAEWVREANRAIYAKAMAGMGRPGMGTTLTALMIEDGHLRAAHVGDTRGYLLRDGQLSRVTRDHSRVAKMVEDGLITEEQAAHHPERNVITRALGVRPDVQVDDFTLDVRPGDRLLLCSDGLHGMVPDPAIRSILVDTPDPNEAAHRLVEAANQGGGVDNITAMVLDVLPSQGGGGGGGRRAWPWIAGAVIGVAAVVGIGVALATSGGSPTPTGSTPVRAQPSVVAVDEGSCSTGPDATALASFNEVVQTNLPPGWVAASAYPAFTEALGTSAAAGAPGAALGDEAQAVQDSGPAGRADRIGAWTAPAGLSPDCAAALDAAGSSLTEAMAGYGPVANDALGAAPSDLAFLAARQVDLDATFAAGYGGLRAAAGEDVPVEIPTASPAPGPSSSKAPTEVPTAHPTTPST